MVKRSLEENNENDSALIDFENRDSHSDQNRNKRANSFTVLKVPYSYGRYYYRNGQLSRGSHSVVYKLYNEDETKIFAGKRLLTKGNKMLRRKIINELELYKLICKAKQVNIVQLIEYFQVLNEDDNDTNGDVYMVLEYANNGTLQSILQYRGYLEEIETKSLILQICGGMYWLHSNNIIHGDLKLGNILIDHIKLGREGDSKKDHEYDIIKICDFGHSFINDGHKNYLNDQSDIVGTPYYLAPEVVCKYKGINVSGKTIPLISFPIDIWAIGVILFTMLYNCNPFISNKEELHSLSITDLFSRITSNRLRIPSDRPAVTKECEDLLVKILRQHPLKRLTLLEVIDHRWFKTGFIKDINLLTPNEIQHVKEKRNDGDDLKEYIDALYEYGFASLLKSGTLKKGTDIKETLKNISKGEYKKRITKYNNINNVKYKVGTVLKENKIQCDIGKRIIVDEIYMTLHNLYEIELSRGKKQQLNKINPDEITPPILINRSKQSVYESDKDTFLYEMTNGQFGCIFNDEHSILLNDMKSTFWYIIADKQNGWISKCFEQDIDCNIDKIPNELNKRLQYVKDCKLDMELNSDMNISILDSNEYLNMKEGDTFLRKYTLYGDNAEDKINLELYILSDNGTFQFNFKEERISIVIQNFGQYFTLVKYESKITISDSYYNILWNSQNNGSDSNPELINMKNTLYDKISIIKDTLKREMIKYIN